MDDFMRVTWCFLFCLVLLCGCSSISQRKQENAAAFASLSPAEKDLVSSGRIERGMDTNAVYIAWGKPSTILMEPPATDQTWIYYGDRPVVDPAWRYLPNPYGYWTLEYLPEHHSVKYVRAEVHFQNGRVADWKKY